MFAEGNVVDMANQTKIILLALIILGLVLSSGCLGNSPQQGTQGGNTTPPGQQPSNGQPTAPANSGGGEIPQPPALPD